MSAVVEINGGLLVASANNDWTLKVDATGLNPATTYYYQFSYGGTVSPVGTTKTLPTGDASHVRLAVFTCANYVKGYFNAYQDAANRGGFDAFLLLGDYIYEYGPGNYHTTALSLGLVTEPRAALLEPTNETVTLTDYRQRYALYRSDPAIQTLHQTTAAIAIWDDHEFADNAYRDGAFNHNPATQGPWSARKVAAIQAFYEWIPIREPASGVRADPTTGDPAPIYRSFDFGNLARLTMLDTRIIGRDLQFQTSEEIASQQLYVVYETMAADGTFPNDLNSDGTVRSMMGTTQEAWVANQLSSSTQTWQLIGNQILYQYQPCPDYLNSSALTDEDRASLGALLDELFGAGTGAEFGQLGELGMPNPADQDAWTGYPSAKLRFAQALAAAPNPVILTGDSHNSWAANLGIATETGVKPLGVEFGTTSVSSPGYEETIPPNFLSSAKLQALMLDTSARKSQLDKLLYCNVYERGYMIIDVTPARVQCDFVFVNTAFSSTYTATTEASYQVPVGTRSLVQVS